MSKLKSNVVFNYIGQFYSIFIGIIVLPLYLKFLGAESYGLIGFFTMLQSWMSLLDLGISPTLSREVARTRGTPTNENQLRTLLRSLEWIFFIISITAVSSIYFSRHWLAHQWLSIHTLQLQEVATCIGLMGVMIGVRWYTSLYRSGISGFEEQVWLNLFNIFFATFRSPLSILIIWKAKGNISTFFTYQLLVTLLEGIIISRKFYTLLPPKKGINAKFSPAEIKRILPFAASTAYTAIIWVFITQLDKLLLSKKLPLTEFGYFSIVTTITSGIMLLSSPVSNAILPRMTKLLAENNEEQMISLYRKASRFIACTITPITLTLAFFPYQIIYIWTGDESTAGWASRILPIFAIGNGILAITASQYYLQYAYGKMKWHVYYNTIIAIFSIPSIYYAATFSGPTAVGYVWLAFRVISLILWTPFIHGKLASRLHTEWIKRDVLPWVLLSLLILLIFKIWLPGKMLDNRIYGFLTICSIVIISIIFTLGIGFSSFISQRKILWRRQKS